MFRRLGLRAKPEPTEPWAVGYDPAATIADIAACFRLLLGRPPNREEWAGHSARAGQALPGVVASYVSSLEFARRGLMRTDAAAEIHRSTLEGLTIYTRQGDAAVGDAVRAGAYEPEVMAVFRRLLRPGMGVIDLGANIGVFTLLSASLVGAGGWVLALEPNPANVMLLEASRRANGFEQVTVCQVAAGSKPGLLSLNTSYSNGTTSGLPDGTDALFTAALVPCVRPDSMVPDGRRIDLIKVDVEGAEYTALLGCTGVIARDRPSIVSEFSPNLMPGISGISGPDYLRWLMSLGYGLRVVQPDGTTGGPASVEAVMQAHEARGTDHVDLLASPV